MVIVIVHYLVFYLSFIFSLQVLQSSNSVLICIQAATSLFLECQSSLPAPSSGLLLHSFLCAALLCTCTNLCPLSWQRKRSTDPEHGPCKCWWHGAGNTSKVTKLHPSQECASCASPAAQAENPTANLNDGTATSL